MNEKTSVLEKIQEKVIPYANKFGQQRHVQAISTGLMYIIPLTLLGAIFNIIANPPVTEAILQQGGFMTIFTGWFHFAQEYNSILTIPFNMTMGMVSVVAVTGISFNLARSYKMKELSTAIMSLIMFLIIASPASPAYLAAALNGATDVSQLMTTNVLDTTYLGSAGLFVAIVIGLVSTEITRFCQEKNLTIKMPDVVPPAVSESFSCVIPAFVNFIILFGIDLLCKNFSGVGLPVMINQILTPAIDNVNSPVVMILIILLGNFLWLFGIHGASIVSALYVPIMLSATISNGQLVAAGQDPVFSAVFLNNFANSYLGITILAMFAKSKQMKAIGKVGIVPGFFMINEPVIFGLPIMFNPILAIPHLLIPAISMLIAWGGYSIGFLTPDFNLIFAQLPLGMNALFGSMSFNNFIFAIAMVGVQIVLWYPFFKLYDKQLIAKEQEAEKTLESEA